MGLYGTSLLDYLTKKSFRSNTGQETSAASYKKNRDKIAEKIILSSKIR